MEQEIKKAINFLNGNDDEIENVLKEKEEQLKLRKEYIEEYKNSLKAQLDNTYIIDENGNKKKLKKKGD